MFNVRALLASVPPWLPPPLPILLPPSGDKSHLNWPSCHHDGATGGRRRKLGMRHRYTYCSAPKCKKAKITSRIKGFSETKSWIILLNQITNNWCVNLPVWLKGRWQQNRLLSIMLSVDSTSLPSILNPGPVNTLPCRWIWDICIDHHPEIKDIWRSVR